MFCFQALRPNVLKKHEFQLRGINLVKCKYICRDTKSLFLNVLKQKTAVWQK